MKFAKKIAPVVDEATNIKEEIDRLTKERYEINRKLSDLNKRLKELELAKHGLTFGCECTMKVQIGRNEKVCKGKLQYFEEGATLGRVMFRPYAKDGSLMNKTFYVWDLDKINSEAVSE